MTRTSCDGAENHAGIERGDEEGAAGLIGGEAVAIGKFYGDAGGEAAV